MQPVESCPSCGSANFQSRIDVKDHSVSGEFFSLASCSSCGLLFTRNAPSAQFISRYYQSEAYISHTDGSKTFFEKIYQLVRRFTLLSKKRLVEQRTSIIKGSLLDIGCGTGAFLATMKAAGWRVHGMEPDQGARSKATASTQINILDQSGLDTVPSSSMDAITLWHVLEHVHELSAMLQTIKRVLTTTGIAFIAVPNSDASDARWYGQFWAAYDVPRHLYHFAPGTLAPILTRHGLRVISMMPMHFDPFYVCLLSEKYRSGSMNIFRSVPLAIASFVVSLFYKQKASSLIYIVTHQH